ncbi:MAG: helix-turn-helix domain-containing protein, partial [Alphaproteobacteria bacterium]
FEVLQKIKSSWPDVPTIVLADQSGIENIVKVMRAGAADFIPKPTNPERLLVSMKNALKMNKLPGQGSQFSRQFEGRSQSDDLIADGCMLVLTAAGEIRTLEAMEADMIRTAIQKYQGRMTEIARRLGIGRSTLYRKVNKFGLLTCGYPI